MKANPEIPLPMNEMRIAQAGSIAFSISSRGVESTRHALEQFIKRRSRHGRTHYRASPRNVFRGRARDARDEWGQERAGGATGVRATSPANRRRGFVRLNRWCELSAAAAIYATPLEVATSFALFRCSRDNRKYAVQYGEGTLWKAFHQHDFKLCIKRRDALRRQARTHSRTGANAPAPCFV